MVATPSFSLVIRPAQIDKRTARRGAVGSYVFFLHIVPGIALVRIEDVVDAYSSLSGEVVKGGIIVSAVADSCFDVKLQANMTSAGEVILVGRERPPSTHPAKGNFREGVSLG